MERYSVIPEKNRREIVLLRAFPCAWGKCSFCDYIEDNGRDEKEMAEQNRQVHGTEYRPGVGHREHMKDLGE